MGHGVALGVGLGVGLPALICFIGLAVYLSKKNGSKAGTSTTNVVAKPAAVTSMDAVSSAVEMGEATTKDDEDEKI